MREQIQEGWYHVLVALMKNDIARADRQRELLEEITHVYPADPLLLDVCKLRERGSNA